ncbi:MAG TPA: hypothetical protein QGF05_04155, partial [Dehalococcoidia bacterium]|nr:hypothetical protein [Dehalococcoidia bacterium]
HHQATRSGDMFAVALIDARCEDAAGEDTTASYRTHVAYALSADVRASDVVGVGPGGMFALFMEDVSDWLGATVCIERVLLGLPGDGRGLPIRQTEIEDREVFLKIRIGIAIIRPIHPPLAQILTEARAAYDRCVHDATFEFAIFDEQRDAARVGEFPLELPKSV